MRTLLLLLLLSAPAHAWHLTPRVGAAVGLGVVEDSATVPFSLGVAVQPSGPAALTGFFSPQLDLELFDAALSYAPTLRFGGVWRAENPTYGEATLAYMQLYLLAGYRLPGGPLRPGSRLGVGLSSPIGIILSAYALEAGLAIPNTVEFVVEAMETSTPTATFRVGLSI